MEHVTTHLLIFHHKGFRQLLGSCLTAYHYTAWTNDDHIPCFMYGVIQQVSRQWLEQTLLDQIVIQLYDARWSDKATVG